MFSRQSAFDKCTAMGCGRRWGLCGLTLCDGSVSGSAPRLLTYAHNLAYTDNGHMIIITKGEWDMPRGDGTGPGGFGPMTGRAAGYCAGYDVPGSADALGERGRIGARGRGAARVRQGAGAGPGRGHRRMYYATGLPGWMRYGCRGWAARPTAGMSTEREKELLGQQVQFLRSELEFVDRRLNDLADRSEGPEQGAEQGPGQGPEQGNGPTEGGV